MVALAAADPKRTFGKSKQVGKDLINDILGGLISSAVVIATTIGFLLSFLYLRYLPNSPPEFAAVIFGLAFGLGLLFNSKRI